MSMSISWASSASARSVTRANKQRDTRVKLLVRRLLHTRGLRYRGDHRVVQESRSRADIAFTRQRIAVFIDGCFWHSFPEHLHLPKANADYWIPKLARNVERDAEVSEILRDLGWIVLRFWEHESPQETADRIMAEVDRVRTTASTVTDPDEAHRAHQSQ
jgi:DNA mismatch endonuclease (patch repair protein)